MGLRKNSGDSSPVSYSGTLEYRCPKCAEWVIHDLVEPFASCACTTGEWTSDFNPPEDHPQFGVCPKFR